MRQIMRFVFLLSCLTIVGCSILTGPYDFNKVRLVNPRDVEPQAEWIQLHSKTKECISEVLGRKINVSSERIRWIRADSIYVPADDRYTKGAWSSDHTIILADGYTTETIKHELVHEISQKKNHNAEVFRCDGLPHTGSNTSIEKCANVTSKRKCYL